MATKKERRIKKRLKRQGLWQPKKMNPRQRELYQQNVELAQEVNRRLKGLRSSGFQNTYASKKLRKRLNTEVLKSWTVDKGGKVKIKKNLTATQMMAVNKAMRQFLASKTSKARGIEQVRKDTIETLRKTLSEENKDMVSQEDAEMFYDLFGDDDFNFFAEKIGSSELQAIVADSIDAKDDVDSWIERLGFHRDIEDLDIRERAERLYDKYIKDDDYNYFADIIGRKQFKSIMEDSKKENDDVDTWINKLIYYSNINDLDTRERAKRLYNKYIQ